jgi:hypothetical protein
VFRKGFFFTIDTLRITVRLHEHHLILKSRWTPVFVNKWTLTKQRSKKTNLTSFSLRNRSRRMYTIQSSYRSSWPIT